MLPIARAIQILMTAQNTDVIVAATDSNPPTVKNTEIVLDNVTYRLELDGGAINVLQRTSSGKTWIAVKKLSLQRVNSILSANGLVYSKEALILVITDAFRARLFEIADDCTDMPAAINCNNYAFRSRGGTFFIKPTGKLTVDLLKAVKDADPIVVGSITWEWAIKIIREHLSRERHYHNQVILAAIKAELLTVTTGGAVVAADNVSEEFTVGDRTYRLQPRIGSFDILEVFTSRLRRVDEDYIRTVFRNPHN